MPRFDFVPMKWRVWLDRIDQGIASVMATVGLPVMRFGLGIVFVWFGALKLVGQSPAADLVATTVYFVPPETFIPVLGGWEVLIGLCLLYRPLIRIGILLLFLQMPGTFLPLIILPDVVYTTFPYGLTVEGQYIIKNLVIGGTVRHPSTTEITNVD